MFEKGDGSTEAPGRERRKEVANNMFLLIGQVRFTWCRSEGKSLADGPQRPSQLPFD